MASKIRTLLLILGAFVVMTAGVCPPELCETFPEACEGLPSGQADSGAQPDATPEIEPEPELAEAGPDEGRT